jgi:methionine-gamma-lyase
MAVSLGYFDTLMSCSGSTTSSEMTEEDKAKAHISPGLVRMSLGYTGTVEQRWRQLQGALERLGMIDAKGRRPAPGRKAS